MTNKTLKALKGSIKKWDDIVNDKGVDSGPKNCPLCNLFWRDAECEECPVLIKTKKTACDRTPYEKWTIHHDKKHFAFGDKHILCPECKKLAKKELAFLKSLLPKEQRNGRSNSME